MTTETVAPEITALQIERHDVVSSNIKAVGYHAETQTLDVEFASSRIYRFAGVPQQAYDALVGAESIGSHFARHVRGKFPSVDLEKLDIHEGSTAD